MTGSKALDYSNSRPSIDSLLAAGVTAVGRYLSPDTVNNPAKLLTASEYRDLHAADIAVFLIWETTADWMRGGKAAGASAVRLANHALVDVLGPKASDPIFYAADWDVSEGDLAGPVGMCFAGLNSQAPTELIGVYGGLRVVTWAIDHGQVGYAWQTYAWSGGKWDSRAQLRQVHNGIKVGGQDVDLDEIMAAHYGQVGDSLMEWTDDIVPNPGSRADSPAHVPPGTNATTTFSFFLGDVWRLAYSAVDHLASIDTSLKALVARPPVTGDLPVSGTVHVSS